MYSGGISDPTSPAGDVVCDAAGWLPAEADTEMEIMCRVLFFLSQLLDFVNRWTGWRTWEAACSLPVSVARCAPLLNVAGGSSFQLHPVVSSIASSIASQQCPALRAEPLLRGLPLLNS